MRKKKDLNYKLELYKLNVVPEFCTTFTPDKICITEKTICISSSTSVRFCMWCFQGDTGGPLSCRDQHGIWKVIGVNSFLLDLSCEMNVVAKINSFINWIQDTMNINA